MLVVEGNSSYIRRDYKRECCLPQTRKGKEKTRDGFEMWKGKQASVGTWRRRRNRRRTGRERERGCGRVIPDKVGRFRNGLGLGSDTKCPGVSLVALGRGSSFFLYRLAEAGYPGAVFSSERGQSAGDFSAGTGKRPGGASVSTMYTKERHLGWAAVPPWGAVEPGALDERTWLGGRPGMSSSPDMLRPTGERYARQVWCGTDRTSIHCPSWLRRGNVFPLVSRQRAAVYPGHMRSTPAISVQC